MSQQIELRGSAIAAGEAAMHQLEAVAASLSTAIKFATGEYWFLGYFAEIFKFYNYFLAKRRSSSATRAIEEFQDALSKLDMEHTADFHLSLRNRTIVHDLLDTGIGELFMRGALKENRMKTHIALSRVRRVVRVLLSPKEEVSEEPVPGGA